MANWGILIIGSAVGGTARYAVSGAAYGIFGTSFPHGTLAVNLAGCLLLGLFDGLAQGRFSLDPRQRMLLMIGFCGAFTTFSTFILETDHLLRDGQSLRAAANVAVSLAGGLICLRLGDFLARTV